MLKSKVAERIFSQLELDQGSGLRPHLGGSQIGKECEREIWYSWRWANRPHFEGRILRLFRRGHNEEESVVSDLRSIGVTVHEVDENTGKQFRVSAFGGHVCGSLDGAVLGIPECPDTWALLEIKTASKKYHTKLAKEGVKAAQPVHFAQMQFYMALAELTTALYVSVCKDDDQIHAEIVPFDQCHADYILIKAKNIICATSAPPRISKKPGWYICKLCRHHSICHGGDLPLKNCRTCRHSVPVIDGTQAVGEWRCEILRQSLPLTAQAAGCDSHEFVDGILP